MECKEKQSQISALTLKLKNPTLPEKVGSKFNSIIQRLKSELELSNSTSEPPSIKYGLVSNGTNISLTPVAGGDKNHSVDSGNEFMAEELDNVSQETLTSYRHSHSWPHFRETFMISSLTKDGVESLKVCVCVCVGR